MKLKKTTVLSFLVLVNNIILGGFFPDTLVKISEGYVSIDKLKFGDVVISSDSEGFCFEKQLRSG